jgi:hypothetical protein
MLTLPGVVLTEAVSIIVTLAAIWAALTYGMREQVLQSLLDRFLIAIGREAEVTGMREKRSQDEQAKRNVKAERRKNQRLQKEDDVAEAERKTRHEKAEREVARWRQAILGGEDFKPPSQEPEEVPDEPEEQEVQPKGWLLRKLVTAFSLRKRRKMASGDVEKSSLREG